MRTNRKQLTKPCQQLILSLGNLWDLPPLSVSRVMGSRSESLLRWRAIQTGSRGAVSDMQGGGWDGLKKVDCAPAGFGNIWPFIHYCYITVRYVNPAIRHIATLHVGVVHRRPLAPVLPGVRLGLGPGSDSVDNFRMSFVGI